MTCFRRYTEWFTWRLIPCLGAFSTAWSNERLNSAHEYFSSKTFSATWVWVGGIAVLLFLCWLFYQYFKKGD